MKKRILADTNSRQFAIIPTFGIIRWVEDYKFRIGFVGNLATEHWSFQGARMSYDIYLADPVTRAPIMSAEEIEMLRGKENP